MLADRSVDRSQNRMSPSVTQCHGQLLFHFFFLFQRSVTRCSQHPPSTALLRISSTRPHSSTSSRTNRLAISRNRTFSSHGRKLGEGPQKEYFKKRHTHHKPYLRCPIVRFLFSVSLFQKNMILVGYRTVALTAAKFFQNNYCNHNHAVTLYDTTSRQSLLITSTTPTLRSPFRSLPFPNCLTQLHQLGIVPERTPSAPRKHP